MLRTVLLVAVAASIALAATVGPYTSGVTWRGISQAGLEFQATTTPYYASTQHFLDKGANLIRIPFRWDRLQVPNGNGNPTTDGNGDAVFASGYWQILQDMVTDATSKGAVVVLDMHNYARYPYIEGNTCGGTNFIGLPGYKATYTHFAGAWKKIAQTFSTNGLVWFGLMNEPSPDCSGATNYASYTSQNARDLMSAGLNAVRLVASNKVVLSGTVWTGAHDWVVGSNSFYGVGNDIAFGGNNKFTDTNIVIEVHTYLDKDHAGGTVQCLDYNIPDALGAITTWANTNGYKLFLGEIGWHVQWQDKPNNIIKNTLCTQTAAKILEYLNNNNGIWLAWAYWGAGPAWGPDWTGTACDEDWKCTVYNADGSKTIYRGSILTTTGIPFTPLSGAGSAEPDWYTGNSGCTPPNSGPNLNNPCAIQQKPVTTFLTTSQATPTSSITAWGPKSAMNTAGGSNPGTPTPPPSSGTCTSPAVAQDAQCGNSAGYPRTAAQGLPSSFACCPSGQTCQWDNDYWWKCKAGSTPAPTTSTTSSTVAPANTGSGSCVAADAQCGNSAKYPRSAASGPDASFSCCVSGYSCQWENDYWWKCKAGSGSGTGSGGGNGGACVADWAQCGSNSAWDGSYTGGTCCTTPGYGGVRGCVQQGGYYQCKPY